MPEVNGNKLKIPNVFLKDLLDQSASRVGECADFNINDVNRTSLFYLHSLPFQVKDSFFEISLQRNLEIAASSVRSNAASEDGTFP